MQFVANPGILQREVDVTRDTSKKELHLIMRVLVPVLTLVESLENEMNLHVILHTRLQSLDAKVESAVQLSWAADCSAKLLDCTSTSRLIAVGSKKRLGEFVDEGLSVISLSRSHIIRRTSTSITIREVALNKTGDMYMARPLASCIQCC